METDSTNETVQSEIAKKDNRTKIDGLGATEQPPVGDESEEQKAIRMRQITKKLLSSVQHKNLHVKKISTLEERVKTLDGTMKQLKLATEIKDNTIKQIEALTASKGSSEAKIERAVDSMRK
jgi:hypothetical protein